MVVHSARAKMLSGWNSRSQTTCQSTTASIVCSSLPLLEQDYGVRHAPLGDDPLDRPARVQHVDRFLRRGPKRIVLANGDPDRKRVDRVAAHLDDRRGLLRV